MANFQIRSIIDAEILRTYTDINPKILNSNLLLSFKSFKKSLHFHSHIKCNREVGMHIVEVCKTELHLYKQRYLH